MPLRPMSREQMWMLPPTLDELVPADHPARFVAEFVDALDRDDWAELGVDIDGSWTGAPAYHPGALLGVWLYGFMSGVRSCRKRDSDARLMRTRRGIEPGYNAQAMVSPTQGESGEGGMLITAAEVTDDPNDYSQLVPMLQEAEETTGVRSEVTLADAGYHSGRNLEECETRGQQVVMPESQDRRLSHPYHKDRFTYDEMSDSYTCPQGQRLGFTRVKYTRGTRMRLYRASGAICRACPAFGTCTRDGRHGRGIEVGPHDASLRSHRALMATDDARQVYKQRQQLVEPVFGIIKEQQGARRFLLRGVDNVSAEWGLLAIAFNLRTLWRAWHGRATRACRLPGSQADRNRGISLVHRPILRASGAPA